VEIPWPDTLKNGNGFGQTHMNQRHSVNQPLGLNLADILYVVFRHKWKIVAISLLGLVAYRAIPRLVPIPSESEAKLYIRYVVETKAPGQVSGNEGSIKPVSGGGESIINTELEILTSRDLARKVAAALGPERLVGDSVSNSLEQAAAIIQGGVTAEVVRDSSVVRVVFQNQDRRIVQPVLSQIISSYFKLHAEIHAVGVFDEFLTQETDQLRSRLAQTEEELRNAKAKAGVISLEDSKSAFSGEIARIQQKVLDAEAELAERRAAAQELAKLTGTPGKAASNEVQSLAAPPAVPADKLQEYKQVCALLESLGRRLQELQMTFTQSNHLVAVVQAQITQNNRTKLRLEAENPGLLVADTVETKTSSSDQTTSPRLELVSELARVGALEAKIKVLTSQLEDIRKRAASVADAEGLIEELQRRKDLQEAHYKKFAENLAQSQLDEKLGAGKVSNISMIEEPTPPKKSQSKLSKIITGVLFGSIAGAFGLAFLIELWMDQSLRRPAEVESKIGVPLFLSIPLVARNGHGAIGGGWVPLVANKNGGEARSGAERPSANGGLEIALRRQEHPLSSYYETLRDRLISFFEMENLTHKPKLVALTSCGAGAGVSTSASGLAASLSETGDGNVLLVNMNLQNGAAHHFHHGKLNNCALEEALDEGTRDSAMVQENLYVVDDIAAGEQLPSILPKRFKQLVPRLKASDFDYIIFDMPPVSQISLTPRLAKFMDVVLMVIESEKTPAETVRKASALLTESGAKVGVVLNKERKYVPQWLSRSFE
jgi:uncharacterized protein involved in exopolysaccharide biosynthesis/Mrp family chromosome partitioning ATPase